VAKEKKISLKKREERIRRLHQVSEILDREFPDAKCALHFETPEQLLFATILSAQCTDVRVNMVTPALFKKYPSSKEMAKAKLADVEDVIKSINFFRNKAKSLIGAAKILQAKYPKEMPKEIELLIELPGVGRKTANVVLGDAFNLPQGIVVDTHVRRLTQLIGLATSDKPEEIEEELLQFVPKEIWVKLSHWLILHGRKTCIARRPSCGDCVIQKICEFGRKEALA
jgi:endonuclease-3